MNLLGAATLVLALLNPGQGGGSDSYLSDVVSAGIDGDVAQVLVEASRPSTSNNPADGYIPDPEIVAEGIGTGGTAETRPAAPPRDVCSPENPVDCYFTGAEPTPPPAGEPAVTLRDIATFHPAPHEHTAEPAG